jgi:hypothetical protein
MLCDNCDTKMDEDADITCYSCGHQYHKYCLLKKRYSLLKPKCPICEKGYIINKDYSKESESDCDSDNDRESDNEYESAILGHGFTLVIHSALILVIIYVTVYVFNLF